MEKNTPSIVFKMQAFLPTDKTEEANFYRCKGNKNYVSYINRPNAQDLPDTLKNTYNIMLDLTGKHPDKNYIDYSSNRHGSTGLFNKDKFLTDNQIKNIQNNISKTDSIVWVGVISFTPEMASKICNNKEDAQKLIAKHFDKLVKGTQIEPDNIDVYGAYHTNTDNPHIHLTFYEKEPKHIDSFGNLTYSRKLMLPKKNFDNFKYGIAQEVLQNLGFSTIRDDIKNSLLVNTANDKFHLTNLVNLSKDIIKEGHFQYNRLSKENKKTINSLVQYSLKNFPETLKLYKNYQKDLLTIQTSFLKVAKDNNLKPSQNAINFFDNRMNDIDERLGNTLLKIIKNEYFRQTQQINYCQNFTSKQGVSSRGLTKLSNSFGLSDGEFKKIIKAFVHDIQNEIRTQSMESYRLEKKLKGEALIYDDNNENEEQEK